MEGMEGGNILAKSSDLQPELKATQGPMSLMNSCFLSPQRQAKSVTAQLILLAPFLKQLMAHWGSCSTRSGSDSEVSVEFWATATAANIASRVVRNCMLMVACGG